LAKVKLTMRSWDDYLIPGSQVLRNKLGITDATELRIAEEQLVGARMITLRTAPRQGRFDFAHFKAIHGYLFGDVYDWAGHVRTAPWDRMMTKSATDVVHFAIGDPKAPMVAYGYYPASGIVQAQEDLHRNLASEHFLQGLDRDEFCSRLGEYWCEINVVHAFREGNTRTQAVFFSQLADHAGWPIDASRFAQGQVLSAKFVAARFYGQATGDSARLAEVIKASLTDTPLPIDRPSSIALQQMGLPVAQIHELAPEPPLADDALRSCQRPEQHGHGMSLRGLIG